MKHEKQRSAASRAGSGAVLLLLLLLLAGGGYLIVRALGQRDSGGLHYEENATVGAVTIGGATQEELQAMVDRSMLTMSINATPIMSLSKPEEGVNWQIENPAEQSTKLIRVEVVRKDTGEEIYATGAIRPGSYVSGTLPDVEFTAGSYDCVAYFYSYDIDTEEFLGKAGSEITLYVQP